MSRLVEQLRLPLQSPGLAEMVAKGVASGMVQMAQRDGALVWWWYPEAHVCEVIGVVGRIDRDADWVLETIGTAMRERGAVELAWTGQRPWERLARRMQ